MTTMDVLVTMADGNPGAITVMCLLLEKSAKIDPDSMFGGLGKVLNLDTYGIYGPRIWQFYKDVCHQNLSRMIGLMRAVQLGHLSEAKLTHAIEHHGHGLEIDELLAKVKADLPAFVLSEAA